MALSPHETLPALLRRQAELLGDAPFVRREDELLSYAEFDARTDAIARGLAAHGVAPGDVVSVWMGNSIAYLEAWWGILKAGATFGPVNPALTVPEAGYVVAHSAARALVVDETTAPLAGALVADVAGAGAARPLTIGVDAAAASTDVPFDALREGAGEPLPAIDPDARAAIVYTSGTTGRPKGAVLRHRNYLANGVQCADVLPLMRGDRAGMMLPLFHVNAQVVSCVTPLVVGASIAMWPRFSATSFWRTCRDYDVTTFSAVPTILAMLLDAPDAELARGGSLRYVLCGAAPLSVELMQRFEAKFGLRILEGYGLTEGTCASAINPYHGARKPGSIGLPIRAQDIRVVRGDGAEAAAGELGELAVRGPNVMEGYLHDPDATAAAIRDGWLCTGDIGYRDADGYHFLVDRAKDMIIRGGENVYPREIEEALYAHPDVREAAVVGMPDPVRGEEVVAFVALAPRAALATEELLDFLRPRLAAFKLPARIEVLPELPKNATGKIVKGPLRERLRLDRGRPPP